MFLAFNVDSAIFDDKLVMVWCIYFVIVACLVYTSIIKVKFGAAIKIA